MSRQTAAKRSRLARRATWLLVAVLAALGIGGFGYFQLRPHHPRYQLAKVAIGPVSATMTLVGTIQPVTSATVTSPIAGTVSSVSATLGEKVTAGELLATVSPNNNTVLAVANDQAALAEATAALAQAQSAPTSPSSESVIQTDVTEVSKSCTSSSCLSALHSLAKLAASQTSGGQQTNGAASLAVLQAMVAKDEAALASAKAASQTASVLAPISGAVASVNFPAGQIVGPSSKYSITVIGLGAWQAIVNVAAANLPSLAIGNPASITIASGEKLTGSISSLGTVPTVDPATGSVTFPVTLSVAGSPKRLFDGMTAVTTITTHSLKKATVIPTSAVIDTGSGPRVGVVTPTGSERLKSIKVGIVGATTTQVLSGLSAGQSVVLANLNAPLPTPSKSLGLLRKAFLGGGAKKGG